MLKAQKMTSLDYLQKLHKSPIEIKEIVTKECGITASTYYKWINGKTKSISPLAKEKIRNILLAYISEFKNQIENLHYEEV